MGTRARIVRSAALLAASWALLSGAAAALTPPQPYVLDANGQKQSLEAAGILNADGRQWAIALGKALFWDQQAGSQGQACASCHFNAGADTRLTNQLSPGFKDITKGPNGDSTFGSERADAADPDTGQFVAAGAMPSGAKADSNYTLKPKDFPLHKLLSEFDRNSPIITTTNDRVSSQGAFAGNFQGVLPLGLPDQCSKADASIFHAGKFAARQVEPRNTPTTINAAFFLRNFLDGRANSTFNGVGVFGMRDILGDPNARLIVLDASNQPQLGYLQVEDASLASQAVGPPLSDLEMSCLGRHFADVGRRLLFTIPLLPQQVAKTDSVLGGYVSASGRGLALKNVYAALIMKAFDKKYWAAPGRYRIVNGQLGNSATGYAQIEQNFSMFWGIAIMLYEQTLVSDQSDLDTLFASGRIQPPPPFTPGATCTAPNNDVDELLLRGCSIFFGANFGPPPPKGQGTGGNCSICHNAAPPGNIPGPPAPGTSPNPNPFLSEAAFQEGERFPLMLRVGSQKFANGAPVNHTHDTGVMSIGLRPVFTDLLNGATDPYGNPLSYSRQYWNYVKWGTPVVDSVLARAIANPNNALHPLGGPPFTFLPGDNDFTLLGVDGAGKSPILRNVALTPPYFIWGGYPTLRQAMKLYNRGLNVRSIDDPVTHAPDLSRAARERVAGTNCLHGDNSGTGPAGDKTLTELAGESDCGTNTTGIVGPLGLIDCEDPDLATLCQQKGYTKDNDDLAALVKFLESLTDRRVQCDQAPFDHPQLFVTDGHTARDRNHDGKADDIVFALPAVGKAGYDPTKPGYCIPNSGDLFAPGMQARAGGALAQPLQ